MSGIVFINYRRRDAEHVAGRLFDRLEQDFSQDQLFFDVDNIPPGEDFVAYLNRQVEACDVLLALVGPNWQSQLDARDYGDGARTKDFVRIEIEAALAKGKRVIPVLVSGAEMPREEDLPESLRPFSRRNAVRLSHERFRADAAGITSALKAALAEAEEARGAAEAEAARQRAEEERKAKAAREAKAQAKRDTARRDAAVAGLSREEIAKAEELANWNFIAAQDDTQKLRDHLARFPEGVTAPMAGEKLEALLWRDLGEAPNVAALCAFLEEFPDGAHAGDARASLEARQRAEAEERAAKERAAKELAAWNAVRDTTDPDTIDAFLADWPHGAHAAEARRLKKALTGGHFTRRNVLIGAVLVAIVAALVTAIAMIGLDRVLLYFQDSSLRTFKGADEHVFAVAFSPDGRTIVSGGADKDIVAVTAGPKDQRRNGATVKLWNVATGEEIRSIENHWDAIRSVAFSPDGRTIAAGGFGTLRLWDAETGEELNSFPGGKSPATFAPDGRAVLSGSRDRSLKLWNAATGEVIRTFSPESYTVAFAPDGRTALAGPNLWDVATGDLLRSFEDPETLWAIAFTPDGRTALAAGSESIKLWDVATGKIVRTFEGSPGPNPSVAVSPDGRTVFSGNWDGTMALWDVATGEQIRTYKGHSDRVYSVAFAPDGRTALSGSGDGTMKLWDVSVEE